MKEPLSSYRIFMEVAKHGSMSKAASTLYISQPAISKSIQKLEEHLNTILFLRTSKGMLLTPEGQLLYEQASVAFQALNNAEEELQHRHTLGMGQLRIGVSTTLCKYLLLPYLKQFIQDNPHIQISIRCQATNDTLKLLESDQIDIGLIGEPESANDLQFHNLLEIQDVFVATEHYLKHLQERGVAPSEILTSATLMLLDKQNMTRQYIDDYLEENHIHVTDSIDVSNLDLLLEFAKIGVGIACVIKEFIPQELATGQLVQIPLNIPIHKRNVGFAYKKLHLQNPALQKFLDTCLEQKKEPQA